MFCYYTLKTLTESGFVGWEKDFNESLGNTNSHIKGKTPRQDRLIRFCSARCPVKSRKKVEGAASGQIQFAGSPFDC